MEDKRLQKIIQLVQQAELKGFSFDITSRRIILHFRDEHQRILLSEINSFIEELSKLLEIDQGKISLLKEYKYLELWIPLKNKV